MEWKTVKIADIGDVYSGGTPSSMESSYWNGSLPWLSSGETSQRYIYNTERSISEEGVKHSSTRFAQKGSIVMASAGQGHTRGQVSMLCIDTYVNQSVLVIKPDLRKIDPAFLFFNLDGRYNELRQLSDSASTRGSISGKILKDLPINLPSLEDQRRIASILSSLDDKIENNNRINANLETQAQALFKSWFVDFEPWGGVMPDDWKETTIGEICTCCLGGTPSRAKAEYWNGDIPWINSGEVNKYRIVAGSEFITELGLRKSATKLLPKKTTVLAITGATLGQVSLLEIEACANQSVIGIVQNEKVPYEFIYPLIKNDIEQIMLHQTGGAQQHINKDNVESHKLILPADEVMAKYKAIQAPVFETIANNCFENQRLAALRDSLLPKLMKGEIAL